MAEAKQTRVQPNRLNGSFINTSISNSNKGHIDYLYDAAGNKQRKTVVDKTISGKTITTITNNANGFIYESRSTVPAD